MKSEVQNESDRKKEKDVKVPRKDIKPIA